jgi:phospho-N-acetylmuramoyl-pentapeptide-transferase
MTALIVSLLCTPAVVRLFRRRGYGQEIREDGPSSHATKRGTPTMGGAVIIGAKLIVGVAFAVAALQFRNPAGLTPASTQLSFVRDYAGISLGTAGFILFAYLVITATSNAVNLTDGLDGLAAGSSIMVFGAYVAIGFWQFRNSCVLQPELAQCYTARDPLDIALVAAAAMGACFGFLWWNCSPAKIFMGDTGSLAIGGAFAGIAIVTQTQLLLIVLGGLFVIETLSVIIQIGVFKLTRKRVFNMAPIHHHFELAGWVENTVIVRFWIIAGLAVAFGLGVFYAEYLATGPLR